ncbi:MAG: hypothetical protein ACRC62_09475 [Microcoleus sp.]
MSLVANLSTINCQLSTLNSQLSTMRAGTGAPFDPKLSDATLVIRVWGRTLLSTINYQLSIVDVLAICLQQW